MSASVYLAGGDLQLWHLLDVDVTGRGRGLWGQEGLVAAGGCKGFPRGWGMAPVPWLGSTLSLSGQADLKGISWCPISIWSRHTMRSCFTQLELSKLHISCSFERAGERAALIPAQTNPIRNSWKTDTGSHVSYQALPKSGQQVL